MIGLASSRNPWRPADGPEIYEKQPVLYYPRDGRDPEKGTVVRWNISWIYVRFGNDPNARACHPSSVGTLTGRMFK